MSGRDLVGLRIRNTENVQDKVRPCDQFKLLVALSGRQNQEAVSRGADRHFE